MKTSPYVPGDLEEAISKLAGQFPLRTDINVHCGGMRMKVHVLIQYRQIQKWSISDSNITAEQMASDIWSHCPPSRLNQSQLFFVWDEDLGVLLKRTVRSPEELEAA